MTPVSLSLPTNLLRRFREQAAEMLPDEPDPFHLALRAAAVEFVATHGGGAKCEAPPATLVPSLTVHSTVPEGAAAFIATTARNSRLTTEQAWHRVVLEFCERSEAPGLELEHVAAKVGAA